MIITVDPADREPPYQQIRIQVLAAIAASTLLPSTRLPTIRQLAADLDLATNTVARAYRELETDGAIETRGRKGTFVRESQPVDAGAASRRQLKSVADAYVTDARRLGLPAGEIALALARALATPRT